MKESQAQTAKKIELQQKKVLPITKDTLLDGKAYEIHPFMINQYGVFYPTADKKTDEVKLYKICEPLFVKDTVQNLDTKEVTLNLCYLYKEKYLEIPISMGQLIPNELLKLSAKGVDIPHSGHKQIADFLNSQQKRAPHREIYREVGWCFEEGEYPYFRHAVALPQHDKQMATNDTESGNYQLTPSGTLAAWTNMIKEEVIGNAPLEMILCAGFSSALVGYLSHHFDEVDSLLIHLAGDSTKGKTTAALLAVSTFGMASNKKKGLQKTWNGTGNAIVNLMSGNFGIPLVLDELSMSNMKTLTSLVYVLTAGQEKSRLSDEMNQRKQGTWATTIISTGEQSILERTSENVGLTIRVAEFSSVTWTSSAANADAIRRVIQENYGYAGVAFVSYMFEAGLDKIERKWEEWTSRFLEALPETPFRTRLAKKYSLLLAAGDIANQAMDLSLDLDNILDFLVRTEADRSESRDIGGKAFTIMSQLIIQHHMNFRREGSYNSPPNCWGKFILREGFVEVAMLKHVVENQLRLAGFEDPKVVIRDWKEKNQLITEGDRNTKRVKIFGENEQGLRKQMVAGTVPKSKLDDVTYNLKIPIDNSILSIISQPLYFTESRQPIEQNKDFHQDALLHQLSNQ